MSMWARLLRRFGYVRIADYGLAVTDDNQVVRAWDTPPAAPAPPRFRPLTPPDGTSIASALPAPGFAASPRLSPPKMVMPPTARFERPDSGEIGIDLPRLADIDSTSEVSRPHIAPPLFFAHEEPSFSGSFPVGDDDPTLT